MILLVPLAFVVLIGLWLVGMYNRLVGLKNQTQNGWRQIDVQLKRRHDLIPNLVNTVKGAMEFEKGTLTAVMEARSKAMSATGPADASRKEGELSQALGRLIAVAENYPQLKSNENVKMLQEELSADGEQDWLRAAVLQRHRDQVQHRARDVPDEPVRQYVRLQRRGAVRDPGRRGAAGAERRSEPEQVLAAVNLLEQQAANRHRTWLVMALFVLVLGVIGAGLDLFVIGGGQFYVPVGTTIALLFGGGRAWWSFRYGDRAVLASADARPLEECLAQAADENERLRYRQLQNVVEEMAIAGGVPAPRAYVIPDEDPNAFATGPDPAHASIAVTEGLLRTLNREELQGVVAHEMAHIRNLDIRLMMVVAALVGAILLLADWSGRSLRFGGGRGGRRRGGGSGGAAGLLFFALWIVAIILAPLIGRLLALAVSRRREYLADATGAELTRNPMALADALEKIEDAVAPTPAIKRGTAHLCIADPLGKGIDRRESLWANLWATHPPMARRIAALKAMALMA